MSAIIQFVFDMQTFVNGKQPLAQWSDDELLLVAAQLDSWSQDLKNERSRREEAARVASFPKHK